MRGLGEVGPMSPRRLGGVLALTVTLSVPFAADAAFSGGFGASHGGAARFAGVHHGPVGGSGVIHQGFFPRSGFAHQGGFARPGVVHHGPIVHSGVGPHAFGHPRVFVPHQRFVPNHFHSFPRHPFFFGAVVAPFPVVGFVPTPTVVVQEPTVLASPYTDTVYATTPPPAYAPPPTAGAPAPPPPTDTVIQYPHGRYELRGDGVTTPYVWVWIPNPPPPPPAPTGPPAAPPSGSTPAPSSSRNAPVSLALPEAYRWVDEQGVTHWTNNWDSVPDQYRSQMKRSRQPSS
jgi:Domain of unknown function (DUF4124)